LTQRGGFTAKAQREMERSAEEKDETQSLCGPL